jgi:hypothetical protein
MYGGPSVGQCCAACDEAIAAAEAEIEVVDSGALPQYFHTRCYRLVTIARVRPGGADTPADRTKDKTRRGGLPAPTQYSRRPSLGDGRPCDGCVETIHPTDVMFTVTFAGALSWQFHDACFDAWAEMK